jgi:NAD(P)H-dependent FMN reductase
VTTPPKIGIILSTTRPTRFADRPATWLLNIAQQRSDAQFEIIDLRDYPMPFYEDERSPMYAPMEHPVARAWAAKLAEMDGFIIVTAEYNHGIPAVLKNALDYAYTEFVRKPMTFVGYGNSGGSRAIEQLRLVAAELQMVSLRQAVQINAHEFIGFMQGKGFADFPYLDTAAEIMLDNLAWWAAALNEARAANPAQPPDFAKQFKAAGA